MPLGDPPTFTVHTGSRLHFGLWAWGEGHERQFGGVGMMVDRPELALRFSSAAKFEPVGPAADRLRKVAERCCKNWGEPELPCCRVEVIEIPRQHTGLGVGTQLSLAVARGLAEWTGRGDMQTDLLATASGRGLRSAVGTHGFARGGLVVDTGKRPGDPLGHLECRVTVPSAWQVVLITPHRAAGIAGESEQQAFAKLPPVPSATTAQLRQIAINEMVPATKVADFDRFSRSVYEYGHQAGLCFASLQGGAYSSEATCHLVAMLREMGTAGVGQSSWGPTVFAFAPSAIAAEQLVARLETAIDFQTHDVIIAAPKNDGASVATE